MALVAASGRLCTAIVFVCWLLTILSQSCRGNHSTGDGFSDDDEDNNMTNSTGFDVLPGLYGVLAASGLIFTIVITLICCTMILVHGKNRILPHQAKLTLLKLREQEEEEDTDWIPEYRRRETPLVPHRNITTLTSLDSTAPVVAEPPNPSNHPDNGGLYLSSRQTTV